VNIFVLDRDPELAAKYHCDKHVVKMILESAQMMCAAHWTVHLKKITCLYLILSELKMPSSGCLRMFPRPFSLRGS